MAMNFTVKEAKRLIESHKALLSKLNHVVARAVDVQTEIKLSANNLISQETVKKYILDDCARPSESVSKSYEVARLITNIHAYQKMRSTVETAKYLQSGVAINVQQNIDMLNPGLAGLSWLFGGKRAKEAATQAYGELTAMLSESYGLVIPHLVEEIDSANQTSPEAAWDAFVNDKYSFYDILETVCPETLHSQWYNPFQTQLSQLGALENKIEKCQKVTDREKEQIKAAAEKMRAFNALQILSSVPVDEVNREKAGYRVKSLKDAGFTTMADIFSASPYQLSSIQGISENAAYSMKRIASQLLQNAQEGVKIKLSADDRSKQATELVKAIYLYRLKNASRDELDGVIQSKQEPLSYSKDVLTAVGNGLPYLFYSAEQRSEVRDAYLEIQGAVDGQYAKKINKLTSVLQVDKKAPAANVVWTDFQNNNIEYISVLEEVVPDALGNDDILYGLPEDLAREIQEEVLFPDGLLCTLRRYQEWGVKYILHQKKVLLGDEMGLGKTVQAIATMVSLRNTGATHFLVVCPASVVTNWCREVTRHSRLRVTKIHGSGRSQAIKSWAKTGGVAVTTFETTSYIKDDSFEKIDLLVVDEAHYIKNPEARRSINVKRLCDKSGRLLFMTGTALENKVEEMVTLIEVLQPDVAASVQGMTFMPSAPQFRNRVAPVYYRRKREDVLTELPELIETKEWCTLNPGEKEIYEQNVLSKNTMASRRLSWDAEDLKSSCKANRLLEIIEEAKSEDRKVLVFSFFLDTIRAIGGLLGARCYGPINGSVPPARRQEIIDSFDQAPAGSVLLAQIQSGGTGLNIQSASVVVICEPQFKPSTENQAISRAYRMGQARNVLVYRLLCANTIDERITELLEYKQSVFDAFADKSVAAEQNEGHDAEIDDKKFGQIIQEEINRINAERGTPVQDNYE